LILYATFEIVTGIIIGYISLAVGWMVGTAMMKGSRGVGGRRYQIAAVLLTYAAVSMAAVPVWIHYAGKQPQSQEQKLEREQQQLESETGQQGSHPAQNADRPRMGLGKWLVTAALLGLASPFLEVWQGGPSFGWMIGLVILFVGMKIAVKLTAGRPLQIYGPFN
jgi:divalent metal cation (Fe/Co/Zn/Cd) transporter